MRVVRSCLSGDSRDELLSAQLAEIRLFEYLNPSPLARFSRPTLHVSRVEQFVNFIHRSCRYRFGQNPCFLLIDPLRKARPVVSILSVFGKEVAVYYSSPAPCRIELTVSVSVLSV